MTAAVINRKLTEQELATEELLDDSPQKPKAAIIGADGNIFNLLGIAQKALKDHGQREQAESKGPAIWQGPCSLCACRALAYCALFSASAFIFSRYLMSMEAASARVDLPPGSRMPLPLPLMMPFSSAQRRAISA